MNIIVNMGSSKQVGIRDVCAITGVVGWEHLLYALEVSAPLPLFFFCYFAFCYDLQVANHSFQCLVSIMRKRLQD